MEISDATHYFESLSRPWTNESNMATSGLMTFCILHNVDPKRRTCSIHTYGSDTRVRGGDYYDVQWLSPYVTAGGEEMSYVPRIGSLGICVFLDNVPWIVGFLNATTSSSDDKTVDAEDDKTVVEGGGSAGQGKEELEAGDFIIRSDVGSKFVLRAGGVIQLESTPLCKRDYIPLNHVIKDTCANYEFSCEAGAESWSRIDVEEGLVLTNRIWRTDLNETIVIQDERGTIIKGKPMVWRQRMGSGSAISQGEGLTMEKTLTGGGTYTFTLKDTVINKTVYSNGRIVFGVNDYSFYQEIRPNGTFYMNAANNASITMADTGKIIIKSGIQAPKKAGTPTDGGPGSAKTEIVISPEGSIHINVGGVSTVKMDKDSTVIDVGNNSSIALMNDGTCKIKAKSTVDIESKGVILNAEQIHLGKKVSDTVPMGSLLVSAINKIVKALNTHTHIVPGGGSYGGGKAAPTTDTAQEVVEDAVLSQSVQVQK